MAILRPSEYFTQETVTDARRKGLDIAERQQRAVEREQEKKGLATAFGTLDDDDPYAAARAKQHTLEQVQWGAAYLTEVYNRANAMVESGDVEAGNNFYGPNIAKLQEILSPEATDILNIDKIRDVALHPNFKDTQFFYLDKGTKWDGLYDKKTRKFDRSVPITKSGWYAVTGGGGGFMDIRAASDPRGIAATAAATEQPDSILPDLVKKRFFDASEGYQKAVAEGKKKPAREHAWQMWTSWAQAVEQETGKEFPLTRNDLNLVAKYLKKRHAKGVDFWTSPTIGDIKIKDGKDVARVLADAGAFDKGFNYPFGGGSGIELPPEMIEAFDAIQGRTTKPKPKPQASGFSGPRYGEEILTSRSTARGTR